MPAAGMTTPGIRMPSAILFALSVTATARAQTTYYVSGDRIVVGSLLDDDDDDDLRQRFAPGLAED